MAPIISSDKAPLLNNMGGCESEVGEPGKGID